jgi:hypothetical protein
MDNQELDRLYTAVRDHKAAYEAAVGVIERQNEAIARVRAVMDRYEWPKGDWDRIPGDELDDALNGVVRDD